MLSYEWECSFSSLLGHKPYSVSDGHKCFGRRLVRIFSKKTAVSVSTPQAHGVFFSLNIGT